MRTLKPMKRWWIGGALCAVCCYPGAHCAFAEPSRIDLEVESIQIQPSRPYSEEPVIMAAVIRNNGSQTAGAFEIAVSVRRDKKQVRSIRKIPVLSTLPRMGSGKSIPVEIGKLPEGDYDVVVTVDPENKLEETHEENNIRIQGFHVSAARYA